MVIPGSETNATRMATARRAADTVDRLAKWIDRRGNLAAGVVLAGYFLASWFAARRKLIWDDEFFTLYISGARNLSDIWKALSTGADQHPPLFYFITHAFFNLFGISHVTLRLPAMIGFALMMVCLFLLVGRRTSPIWGIAAMLLPLSTEAAYYATEGRGYGLVLGFGTLALLAWQLASEGRLRVVTVPLLGLALSLAVSSHYYAILLVFPLVAGEVVRIRQGRRIDIPVGIALATTIVPLALFYPIIRGASGYSATFWAKPEWGQGVDYYKLVLGPALPLMMVVGALFLIFLKGSGVSDRAEARIGKFAHETVAWLVLSGLPVTCLVIAMYVTNGFHRRYVLIALAGFTMLFVNLCYDVFRGRRSMALVLALLVGMSGVFTLNRNQKRIRSTIGDMKASAAFLRQNAPPDLPLVMAEVTQFHRLTYYAPPKFMRRMAYLANPTESVRYLGHDTIDRGLLALRPWFPERIEEYGIFTASHPDFLMYGYIGSWTWHTYTVLRHQFQVQVLARQGDRLLMRVTKPGLPASGADAGPGAGVERARSLCAEWTRDSNCRILGMY